jgi:hypothetical protein
MSYKLTNSQGKTVAVIQDGSIDKTSTSINLPGRNYAGYGMALNENLIYLLENFAGTTSPNNPLAGQLWYDSLIKKLKLFNGTTYKSVSNLEYTSTTPVNQTAGDLWLNTNTSQLFFFDGSKYNLVGPLETGQKTNQTVSAILFDLGGNPQTVLLLQVTGTTVALFSSTEFFLDSVKTPLTGWENNAKIYKGINLPSQSTYANIQFAGVAQTAASLLVGNTQIPASQILLNQGTQQNITTSLKVAISPSQGTQAGLFIGSNGDLYLSSQSGLANISNINSNTIVFSVKPQTKSLTNVLQLTDAGLIPSTSDTYDLGSVAQKFNVIYANNFLAIDDPSQAPGNASFQGKVLGTTVSASLGFTGNLSGNVLNGVTRVVDNSAAEAVFRGQLIGSLVGSHTGNVLSTTTQGVVIDTSLATATFNGNLNGVATSASSLFYSSRSYPTLDSTNTAANYSYTSVIRDGNGNVYANNYKGGPADIAVQLLDSTTTVGRSAQTGTWSPVAGSISDPNTVVVRDGASAINVSLVRGTAWNAQAVNNAQPFIQNTTSSVGFPGAPAAGTLVQRDPATGNIYVGDVHCGQVVTGGGDVAEWYKTDKLYPQGTIVMLGGDAEITIADDPLSAFGIISMAPGVIINDGDYQSTDAHMIALTGRVGVLIKGKIKRGDRIMLSDENGVACKWDGKDTIAILGRSIQTSDDADVRMIEVAAMII